MVQANINEIFLSLQGEGAFIGVPFVFVRLNGCSLKCHYCDTVYALSHTEYCKLGYYDKIQQIKNPVSPEKFKEIISHEQYVHTNFITFTGGEPLEQSDFIQSVLNYLGNKKILIETNGVYHQGITESLINRVDYWSVDYKLTSLCGRDCSTDHRVFLEKLSQAKSVYIKIVIDMSCMDEEWELALEFLKDFSSIISEVIIQPLNGLSIHADNIHRIIDTMKNYSFRYRILPQLHKILHLK